MELIAVIYFCGLAVSTLFSMGLWHDDTISLNECLAGIVFWPVVLLGMLMKGFVSLIKKLYH